MFAKPFATAAILGASLIRASAASAADPAFGLWLTEAKTAIVEIAACSAAPEQACGTVVWLETPTDAAGAPRVDEKNEEAALRSRPLCGLPVVGDFTKQSDGSWDDGFIYDAKEGDLYDAEMEALDDGTLKVRGSILGGLIGRSQIWTPVEDNRGGC